MPAEQNLPKALAGQKTGLGALQFDFFQFLASLAFKIASGKSCLARQLVYQLQQRFRMIAETRERNRTVVLAGANGKIRTEAAKKLFDFAAGIFRSSSGSHG